MYITVEALGSRGTTAKLNGQSSAELASRHEYFLANGSELNIVREEDGHYVCEIYVYKGHARQISETYIGNRKLSKAMFNCLQQLEGIKLSEDGCKAIAYKDIRGIWTIGYGSTNTHHAFEGNTITLAEAEELYKMELSFFVDQVNKQVMPDQLDKLSQKQFDCLVSFCFNIGHNGFKTSTALKQINKGRFDLVPYWMLQWNKPAELLNRRKHEASLWEGGSYELSY